MRALLLTILVVPCMVGLSCSAKDDEPLPPKPAPKIEDLLDSKSCGGCHREHYKEWAGSMHAYAADDPLFRALNARMQREVPAEQRDFCMKCHAPMAVALGKPADIAALDATPELKGVTCVFCHAVVDVRGTHNNALVLGTEPVMGGAIRDPVTPSVHKAEYRTWLDGTQENQSGMCGACHDIVALGGAHIERTFREWGTSKFGVGERIKVSCASCHMAEREGVAAVNESLPQRKLHDHTMAGVDLALTPFPDREAQRAQTQALLDSAIKTRLCVEGTSIDVRVTNEKVGHSFPSGSNQDRRSWLELQAFAGDSIVFTSGVIPDDIGVATAATTDPNLFLLRDYDFDANGAETHFFWRTAKVTNKQIPAAPPGSTDPEKRSVHAKYTLPTEVDRVTVALKIRAVDHDLVDALVADGDLDRSLLDRLPTFVLGPTKLEWLKANGTPCVE